MFTYLSKQDGEIIMAFWSNLNGHFRLQYACQEGDPDGLLDEFWSLRIIQRILLDFWGVLSNAQFNSRIFLSQLFSET